MSYPKISVIIPFFNVEKYIDKCLWSVRNQTLKDIEIICVDDCSPDNSRKIVEKHLRQDSRIKLITHKKNLGLGGARNTAIRIAKSEFIASVDSDDYVVPTMLEVLWEETDDGWYDIVSCSYSRVDENENILSTVQYQDKQFCNDDNNINIFTTLSPAFWNKLWRKSLFIDNDIFFPEHDYYEDMSTTPRLLVKSKYVKIIKANLYRYLIRDGSIMNRLSDKHVIDYLKGFEIIQLFLDENGLKKRYSQEFDSYIRGNFLYYSKSIMNASVRIDNKIQYLRYLVLFRITFIENYQLVKNHDLDSLIILLSKSDLHSLYYNKVETLEVKIEQKEGYILRQIEEIQRKKMEIESRGLRINDLISNHEKVAEKHRNEAEIHRKKIELLNAEIADSLSFPQMLVVISFALLTILTLNKKQRVKLVNQPKKFFKDSKSKFAKQFARRFGIV